MRLKRDSEKPRRQREAETTAKQLAMSALTPVVEVQVESRVKRAIAFENTRDHMQFNIYTGSVVHNVAPEPNLAPWQNLFGSFAFYFV